MTEGITAELPDWSSYSGESWPTLLVGNGLSINLWSGFRYDSLYNQAELSPQARDIFGELRTTNFETALECLYHANLVLTALRENYEKADQTYNQIRDALFAAVGGSHIPWRRIQQRHFASIAAGMDSHEAVYTTNYDLCLYWSHMETPSANVVDFFWNRGGIFRITNVAIYDEDSTAIYYLHGGLHLWQDDSTGESGKWRSSSGNLLDFEEKYHISSTKRPLFVSEGTPDNKVRTINRSSYLSFCLERLHDDEENTVIFGHALGTQDRHIIEALNDGPERKIAVSIYPTGDTKGVIAEKGRVQNLLARHEVLFFNSQSHPLGSPVLHIA